MLPPLLATGDGMGFFLGEATSQPLPASSDDEAVRFIKRALPNAGPGRRIGLHWFPNDPESWAYAKAHNMKRPVLRGRAYEHAEDAVSYARWMLRQAEQKGHPPPDLYACMALCGMEVAKTTKAGRQYFEPTRKEAAHRASRTLFLDLDVQTAAKAKGYPDKATALASIDTLVAQGKLPSPTMRVDSGNGLHIHWVLDRELNFSEWKTLARAMESYVLGLGVVMDRGVAVDSVRVLRLPNTLNAKDLNAPIPTALVGDIDPTDIPVSVFESLLGTNLASAPPVPVAQAPAQIVITPHSLPAPFLGFTPFVPVPAEPEFSDGIDPNQHVAHQIDFARVVAECPALSAMHARKGAGDPGVLWMLALLATTFAPEADRQHWAHELSSGHAQYTVADTDAKVAEKIRARAASGGRIGWPSCNAFSQHCGECKTCPHFAKQQTPLHNGIVVAPAIQAAIQAAAQAASEIPAGFSTDPRGVLCTLVQDGEEVTLVAIPHHIEDPCLEDRPEGVFFSARVTHTHNPPTRLRLPISAATAWRDEATKALGAAHIALLPEQIPLARRFFVSFIQLLQSKQSNVVVRDPYGWVKARDGSPGFAFDGRVFHAGGEEASAGADDHFRTKFHAQGEIAAWKEAADLVMGMGRIDLQCAMATAFAAPLMKFTGENGVIVSIYSPFSGVQKSSAIKVAQAVWGDPRSGLTRLDDTANAVGKKLGALRHLPVYWDELQRRDQTEAFARIAFSLTQGTEKSRMGADTKLRQSGEWATMLVCGSNNSVRELMFDAQAAGSAAGIARVLEFEVRKVPLTSSAAESAITLGKTHDNYGLVGVEYARLLASMPDKLQAALAAVGKSFEQKVGSDAEQRFWIAAASTIYLGASLANRLAVPGVGALVRFPLPALHEFLCTTIRAQQEARKADVIDLGSVESAARVVQRYIDHCRTTNTALETNVVPKGAGRPVLVEHRFPTADAPRMLRAPKLHVAHDDGIVRVVCDEFRRWVVQDCKLPWDAVKRDLERYGSMIEQRSRWAAGTAWTGALTKYYQIDTHYGRTPLGARIGHGR